MITYHICAQDNHSLLYDELDINSQATMTSAQYLLQQ
jgi:hypothetical protein